MRNSDWCVTFIRTIGAIWLEPLEVGNSNLKSAWHRSVSVLYQRQGRECNGAGRVERHTGCCLVWSSWCQRSGNVFCKSAIGSGFMFIAETRFERYWSNAVCSEQWVRASTGIAVLYQCVTQNIVTMRKKICNRSSWKAVGIKLKSRRIDTWNFHR